MAKKNPISFDDAVFQLAKVDGTDAVLQIPGIWEEVSEYYNNDAIALMEAEGLEFDDAVFQIAKETGTDSVLGIPGVWEEASEYYNNAAIDLMQVEENPTPISALKSKLLR